MALLSEGVFNAPPAPSAPHPRRPCGKELEISGLYIYIYMYLLSENAFSGVGTKGNQKRPTTVAKKFGYWKKHWSIWRCQSFPLGGFKGNRGLVASGLPQWTPTWGRGLPFRKGVLKIPWGHLQTPLFRSDIDIEVKRPPRSLSKNRWEIFRCPLSLTKSLA